MGGEGGGYHRSAGWGAIKKTEAIVDFSVPSVRRQRRRHSWVSASSSFSSASSFLLFFFRRLFRAPARSGIPPAHPPPFFFKNFFQSAFLLLFCCCCFLFRVPLLLLCGVSFVCVSVVLWPRRNFSTARIEAVACETRHLDERHGHERRWR